MPRYFFHMVGESPDLDGAILDSDHAAWAQAVTACGELIRSIDGDMRPGEDLHMNVEDEMGDTIFSLRFSTGRRTLRDGEGGTGQARAALPSEGS